MIKFFRKIRQRLLVENRLGRYFFYAIGEIVLVVIGILIALQINNANQSRKDRIKEKALLLQIHRDFKSNKIQLDSIRSNNERAIAACDSVINLLPFDGDRRKAGIMLSYLPQIMSIKTFNPTNGTVDALISSSSFEVIQDDSLRNLLVSWKDRYRDYTEEEQYSRDLQIWQLTPYMRANFNFLAGPSPENLENMKKFEFMNFFFDKRTAVQEVQNAMRDEGIELYIDEIIRLTANND